MTCESPEGGSYRDIEKQTISGALVEAGRESYRQHREAKREKKMVKKAEREARKKKKEGSQHDRDREVEIPRG